MREMDQPEVWMSDKDAPILYSPERMEVPRWLEDRRDDKANAVADDVESDLFGGMGQKLGTNNGIYRLSRDWRDQNESTITKDYAFNRHSINDGEHVSPFDNGRVQVGSDGIEVSLVQGIDEDAFKRTLSMATRATIGIDISDPNAVRDNRDWEEMLKGGLQTALETQVLVFAVKGASRTATHQLVRSRRAAFHQQSQRASYMGDLPECRMPESVWRNVTAREAFLKAMIACHEAYQVICEQDVSYQDARFILPEGTANFIMLEYPVREFLNVYAYRACSMFQWEIVSIMRQCREALVEKHPWLAPYIKISCQSGPCPECAGVGYYNTEANVPGGMEAVNCHVCLGTGMVGNKCTFQGWEDVEGQCDFSWAKHENRTFKPEFHRIGRRPADA